MTTLTSNPVSVGSLAAGAAQTWVEDACANKVQVPYVHDTGFTFTATVLQLKGRLECPADGLNVLKALEHCERVDGVEFKDFELTLTWHLGWRGETDPEFVQAVQSSVQDFVELLLCRSNSADLHVFVQSLKPVDQFDTERDGLLTEALKATYKLQAEEEAERRAELRATLETVANSLGLTFLGSPTGHELS